MPRLLPFQGVRYNPALVSDIARVTAPPYDMISPAEQEDLYRLDPHNVVRLILGREREDGHPVDRYANAAAFYRRWRSAGVLTQDAAPAIYLYREDYSWAGRRYQRLGVIARIGLDEFGGGAFAHESTMSGPKADRLRLLQACETNFSQIFALYSDPDGSVEAPLLAATAGPAAGLVRRRPGGRAQSLAGGGRVDHRPGARGLRRQAVHHRGRPPPLRDGAGVPAADARGSGALPRVDGLGDDVPGAHGVPRAHDSAFPPACSPRRAPSGSSSASRPPSTSRSARSPRTARRWTGATQELLGGGEARSSASTAAARR